MIYSKGTPGNGVWHCPFSPEWVEQMRRAAKHCEPLSAEHIERCINNEEYTYQIPPGDFLDGPQDARGLPVGYGDGFGRNVSCDIYDYTSIPDMVISNGRDDWQLRMWEQVITA